jgi:dimethylhistidine N-methyltransferase
MTLSPQFIDAVQDKPQALRTELVQGLLAAEPCVAAKYLYDTLGSRLFEAITELPEYYPTRCEAGIFAQHAPAMAALMPPAATLVDLGAGNCRKAAQLFDVIRPARYVAVDISVAFLRPALSSLQAAYPAIPMLGLGLDFSADLSLPAAAGDGARVLFYPGSSIGNFSPEQALAFLQQAHVASQGGGLLIGVDLHKDTAILEPAYDDALGVTAAFNRNVLLRLNLLTGSNFALADWQHVAFFNSQASRIEMHLQARAAVQVRWPGGERQFAQGQRIHTENSYKWQQADFAALLQRAGFSSTRAWTDTQGWFAVYWAQA